MLLLAVKWDSTLQHRLPKLWKGVATDKVYSRMFADCIGCKDKMLTQYSSNSKPLGTPERDIALGVVFVH